MIWWATLLLFQPPLVMELPTVDRNPHSSDADVAHGKKLYAGRCAGCHGPKGDGGKGANLAAPVLPRASGDLALYRVVRYGIPETEMPATLLTPREVWQIAAFVRTLGRVSREALPGDAARGGRLVRGKGGCFECHAVGLEGGHLGPALTDVGSRRGAAHLRGKLLDPAAELPEQYRVVELTTQAGQKLSGVRLNEDTWSLQIRDFGGKFHSFWKRTLQAYRVERRTPMPSYRERFNAQELDDVIAYLSGLRGEQ